MNKFKSIIMKCHGKSKNSLHWLYNTHSDYEDEEEKIFKYKEFTFWFSGTGFRNTERMMLYIGIPEEYLDFGEINTREANTSDSPSMMIAEENYILQHIISNNIIICFSFNDDFLFITLNCNNRRSGNAVIIACH